MSNFKAPWWLSNPHLQTIWPTFCRKPPNQLSLESERLELPDGDFIDLNWLDRKREAPLVLLLHGFEGSIESPYAKGMLHALNQQGWRGLFVHFRGCSGEPNRAPRSYHSGDTGDIAYLVKILQEREPHTPKAAIGFSLGGNVLLKWLGETAFTNPLTAAIAISVPFELSKTAYRIQKGFSRIYEKHFLKCLSKRLGYKFKKYPPHIPMPNLENLKTLIEFDDRVTAPLHGFKDATDYYEQSSCRQYLHAIRTPTLIIQAKDDPLIDPEAIPDPCELSPQVTLEVTENGGHVGFIQGKYPWRAEYWLEKKAVEFLRGFKWR